MEPQTTSASAEAAEAEAPEAPEAPEAQVPDAAASEVRNSGSCKWFNASKGYGFIEPEGGGEDLFVHQVQRRPSSTCHRDCQKRGASTAPDRVLVLQSNLEMEGFRSLREGESVNFVTEIAPDGRQKAIKVTGPGGAAPQARLLSCFCVNNQRLTAYRPTCVCCWVLCTATTEASKAMQLHTCGGATPVFTKFLRQSSARTTPACRVWKPRPSRVQVLWPVEG